MKTDSMIKQSYRLTLDDETHLISLVYFWDEETKRDDVRSSEMIVEEVRAMLASNPSVNHYGYVDLSLIGDLPTDIPMESIRLLVSLSKEANLKRVVIVGAENHMKHFVDIALDIASGGKMAWFTDVQKARDWLFEKE